MQIVIFNIPVEVIRKNIKNLHTNLDKFFILFIYQNTTERSTLSGTQKRNC